MRLRNGLLVSAILKTFGGNASVIWRYHPLYHIRSYLGLL